MPTYNRNNEGVLVQGNCAVNANQVVAGRNAQAFLNIEGQAASNESAEKADVLKAIKELQVAFETHNLNIADKDEASQALQQLAQEVCKEKPNKITLKGLLSGIQESLGSVIEISDSIANLQKVVSILLGLPIP